jgi:N-acetylneuraminic acid mutarotase
MWLLIFTAINTNFCFAKESKKSFILEQLPQPLSNNAVASLSLHNITYIASFYGLTESKLAKDVTSKGYLWRSDTKQWQTLPSLPGGGKLASSAVTIKDAFYIIGGYTIAADGTEKSTPEIYKLSFPFKKFQLQTHMPIPVDDSVALVYQDRYLYLVSGWHDAGNVSDTQIYDTQTNLWTTATAFPGVAVFGHAAAISRNQIIVIDGVGVVGKIDGKRQFAIIPQAWKGEINKQDITKIDWIEIPNHSGKARYRMAAFYEKNSNQLVFLGGSDNPYNYNGIGYDGIPSKPVRELLLYGIEKSCWLKNNFKGPEVMDLRGVVNQGEHFGVVGGMGNHQSVLNQFQAIEYNHHALSCE